MTEVNPNRIALTPAWPEIEAKSVSFCASPVELWYYGELIEQRGRSLRRKLARKDRPTPRLVWDARWGTFADGSNERRRQRLAEKKAKRADRKRRFQRELYKALIALRGDSQ